MELHRRYWHHCSSVKFSLGKDRILENSGVMRKCHLFLVLSKTEIINTPLI